jgi:hypothetical protein
MALSKAERLRCAASFVIAAYFYVRLIPQDLRALHLDLFSLPSDSDYQTKATEHFNLASRSCHYDDLFFH